MFKAQNKPLSSFLDENRIFSESSLNLDEIGLNYQICRTDSKNVNFVFEQSEWNKLSFVRNEEARASNRNLIYKFIYLGCAIRPHLLVKKFPFLVF